MLIYDFRSSGVVRNILRIAAAAQEANLGVEVWVVRRQGDLLDSVPPNVPVFALHQGPTRRSRALDSLLSVAKLARAIRSREPAVLLSGGNHIHIHSTLGVLASGRRRSLRFVGRASNAVISASGGWWRKSIRPFERFQYASMDRIISVSEELSRAVVSLGPASSRVSTIPNGIDLEKVDRSAPLQSEHPFLVAGGPPVVLGIGRLSRQKNFDGLLRAFAAARAHRPLRLMILGSGPTHEVERLRRLAARLGIEDEVALQGFVPDPLAYLKRADLFVLSSRWEGASNVLLEALACGCPIVATRAPTGVLEVLKHGQIAPLVPVGDDRGLADAMLKRLGQSRDGQALRLRASDFDLSRTLGSYVRILSEEYAQVGRPMRAHKLGPMPREYAGWDEAKGAGV